MLLKKISRFCLRPIKALYFTYLGNVSKLNHWKINVEPESLDEKMLIHMRDEAVGRLRETITSINAVRSRVYVIIGIYLSFIGYVGSRFLENTFTPDLFNSSYYIIPLALLLFILILLFQIVFSRKMYSEGRPPKEYESLFNGYSHPEKCLLKLQIENNQHAIGYNERLLELWNNKLDLILIESCLFLVFLILPFFL